MAGRGLSAEIGMDVSYQMQQQLLYSQLLKNSHMGKGERLILSLSHTHKYLANGYKNGCLFRTGRLDQAEMRMDCMAASLIFPQ